MKTRLLSLLKAPSYAQGLNCSAKSLRWSLYLALVLLMSVEVFFLPKALQSTEEEAQAIKWMGEASAEIKQFRIASGVPIDAVLDPNQSGLIGLEYSDLTTTEGVLVAKRTSLNPAFAGVIVRLLKEAGVKEGDKVAVSLTGSFPALNIATLVACRALNLQPQIISSVGASAYGANIPNLTWLDMESRLVNKGILPFSSLAVSFGGVIETSGGIDGTGLILAEEAIKRHGAPFLEEGDYRVVEKDALARKKLFAQEGEIRAFINVGGALTALGWVPEAAKLDAGLLTQKMPKTDDGKRGLIFRYAEDGVPVIHLLNIVRLAERYALPVDPIPLPEAIPPASSRFLWRYFLWAMILCVWAVSAVFFLRIESASKTS